MSNGGSKDGSSLAHVVAAGAVVFFGAISVYLIRHTSDPDPAWSRLVYVYGGIEALVFAAAGALFGSRAERSNSRAAEKRAEKAEEEAAAADKDATTGRALVAAVRAERVAAAPQAARTPRPSGEGLSTETIGAAGPAPSTGVGTVPALDRLTALIDELQQ